MTLLCTQASLPSFLLWGKLCTSFIPEAREVLDLVDQCPEQVQKGRFPVIVIEGLDATGKTTVTQSVSDSLKAVLLKSPPSCISQWRKIFDDEPTIIRRAFYSLGNYIVASEIAKESTKSPVVVDRYWHSTATYAIATEVSGGLQHLPPIHHPIYQWPRDLLKPDLILLLTVSPEERMQRIEGRGMEKTREEAELETNSIFRQKVEVCYQRMENPGCHVVDASPSREKVLQMVLSLLRARRHILLNLMLFDPSKPTTRAVPDFRMVVRHLGVSQDSDSTQLGKQNEWGGCHLRERERLQNTELVCPQVQARRWDLVIDRVSSKCRSTRVHVVNGSPVLGRGWSARVVLDLRDPGAGRPSSETSSLLTEPDEPDSVPVFVL
ncbi:hypothetical protein E5288_WYG015058 [Bos mutus]|uniref:UMP-CMP kinase 2, mitochondrial n=1 Tax=Bos mutus TaxID=72004 RepID=A0A6B0RMF6_9CETA|nr:hypothetical protein [Bos mutus]